MPKPCLTLTEFLTRLNEDPDLADEYQQVAGKPNKVKAFFDKYEVCAEARKALKNDIAAVQEQVFREQFKVVIFASRS